MFNSSFLNIETPKKNYIRQVELTPVKLGVFNEPFRPSWSVKKKLSQMLRIHNFQYHQPVKFLNLKELNMNRDVSEEIVAFMATCDIPDTISRLEEIALETEFFNVDLKEYISEEFNCEQKYSFGVLAVFHYMKIFHIGKEAALEELFTLSIKKAVCLKCISGLSSDADKVKAADVHNFQLLKSLRFCDAENDYTDQDLDSDDSMNDKEYKRESDEEESSDESISTPVKNDHKVSKKIFNPFLSPEKDNDVFEFSLEDELIPNLKFNPFLPTKESDFEQFSPDANSTMCSNPFKDIPSEKFVSKQSSEIRSSSINCEHCVKVFSNRYNMKLHLIRFDS